MENTKFKKKNRLIVINSSIFFFFFFFQEINFLSSSHPLQTLQKGAETLRFQKLYLKRIIVHTISLACCLTYS